MNPVLNSELFEAFANASDRIYVYVADLKESVTRYSKAAVEYLGLPSEYIHNANDVWLSHVHPEDRDGFSKDIGDVLSGKNKHHNYQYRLQNRYGEYIWVECKGSVILDEEGKPDLFAGIVTRLDNHNKYDPLTHLLTGGELMYANHDEDGVLMIIGIDGFRKINSEYGFSYGNDVLKYLANLLKEKSRGATAYRIQGDEFILHSNSMTCDDLVEIFEDVKNQCNNSEKEDGMVAFSITAGVIEFSKDEETFEVVNKSDVCYNYAKENNVGGVVVYSDEIRDKINRKKLVSERLLKCIKNNFEGFRLVYQPILANTGDTVVACEALLRWNANDEKIGACYPDEFISILEANGGMRDVGYFVMREAIRQASVWQSKYKDFNVSFNVSYVQLEDVEFVPAIIDTINKYGADPKKIVVELTESILNVDTVKVKQSFELLRDRGINIALDDFGTGNSSFWMLHNIAVDIVKLDQSFIRKLDTQYTGIDHAIVESVGLMCDRIGCKTVAEGVETEEIWKMVSEYGFTGLQGYLFSRPIEVADFEELLEKYGMCK